MDNFNQTLERIVTMLVYEQSVETIHDILVKDGLTEEQVFFMFQAARILRASRENIN